MGRRLALNTKPLPSYDRPRNGYQVPLWSTEGIHGLSHAVGPHDHPGTGRLIKAMSSSCSSEGRRNATCLYHGNCSSWLVSLWTDLLSAPHYAWSFTFPHLSARADWELLEGKVCALLVILITPAFNQAPPGTL